jgi:hypothetical protein
MRGSYSGNTSAFQADAESSILLPRSKKPGLPCPLYTGGNTGKPIDATVHWIYRKVLFRNDLRNHKGRDVACLNGKERGRGNHPV